MIDAQALARALRSRLQERRVVHYERLAACLPNNEYFKVCGMVAEDDALLAMLDEVRKSEYEDDDDPDPLTDPPRKRNGKVNIQR